MRLLPWLGCKRIFGVFRAQGTCLVAANVVYLPWGANSAPQISYLDLRGHFEAVERDEKRNRKKEMEGEG